MVGAHWNLWDLCVEHMVDHAGANQVMILNHCYLELLEYP